MPPRSPLAELPTHSVQNMPPHLGDQDLWANDKALQHWTKVFGANWAIDHMAKVGKAAGAEETLNKANQANRYPPELRAFDRYGMRLNQVEFHPAYHDLMDMLMAHEVHSFKWNHPQAGSLVAHSALTYMFSQPEGGALCPMSMTFSVIPALKHAPEIMAEWLPRILSTQYDSRDIPASEKTAVTVGMFMTEKQGGSDVRSNSTTARPLSEETGANAAYLLNGHKFFCSAPMSDAFFVLANTADRGISCFLVPRWKPDGTRNCLYLQRLKDKLGNRSNASSEMEFSDTYATMVGEEGRGIRIIIDMVIGNRLYCANSSAGLMRQALVQALHHTSHRSAFQKRLIQQPLMQNVLADMAIESEAALALCLRVARAMENGETDPAEAAFARVGVTIAKYWVCKRAPSLVVEALECHGGPGYVEESILPRLYREAPLNSIWEGSGNIMCLDVLRALAREPEALEALFSELEKARGLDSRLDQSIDSLHEEFADPEHMELRARTLTQSLALALQGALLLQHSPSFVAQAFCASRLSAGFSGAFGTLPADCDMQALIDRAMP